MKAKITNINVEKILETIVLFLIIVKIIFAISVVGDIIIKYFTKDDTKKSQLIDAKFVYWKHVTEFIFVISMSLLLIFIFNPWHTNQIYITREMSIMFYAFGYIMLFTADWGTILPEPAWFKRIKSAVKFDL